MSELARSLEDHLAVRRAVGFKLIIEERMLADFVDYAERAGVRVVTTELALAWATLPPQGSPHWLARRLRMVRGFARHLHAVDRRTEVPPVDLLVGRHRRPTPHLYSDTEVAALLRAARRLGPPLRAATVETLIVACVAVEDGAGVAADPGFGGGVAGGVQGPGCFPFVFQDVDEVDQDRDRHVAVTGFVFDLLDLVVVAIDQGDPGVVGVAPVGFVKDLADDGCGVVGDAGGEPFAGADWAGCELGCVAVGGGRMSVGVRGAGVMFTPPA